MAVQIHFSRICFTFRFFFRWCSIVFVTIKLKTVCPEIFCLKIFGIFISEGPPLQATKWVWKVLWFWKDVLKNFFVEKHISELCPGKLRVKLSAVPDSVESSSALSVTAWNQAELLSGSQSWSLSETALSQTQSSWLVALLVRVETKLSAGRDSALLLYSRTKGVKRKYLLCISV